MQGPKVWGWLLLTVALAGGSACSVSLPVGELGAVPMAPFVDEQAGIRGMAPLPGWSDRAELVQQTGVGTIDEFVAMLSEQTDLVSLPRSTGSYQGKHLRWDLYTAETQVVGAPPGIYRLRMGIAHQGATFYFVVLVVVTADYDAGPEPYDAVFEHALYALGPTE
ncbi:MAG: hypothetical protein JXA09_08050 [Anaerolineae bacterium]|nr:hypothetical protein [Anaerolineae bacterium]